MAEHHDTAHGTAQAHGHGNAYATHPGGAFTEHEEHHEEHIHPQRHYVQVWAALVVLFLISVAGPMIGIKILTLITAFGIATVKAGMVVKYFMHLDVEKRFVHYFLATSVVFMFLLFAAVAPDVMKHEGTHWVNVAARDTVQKGLAAPPEEHGGEHAAPAGEPHHE